MRVLVRNYKLTLAYYLTTKVFRLISRWFESSSLRHRFALQATRGWHHFHSRKFTWS